MNDVMSNLDRRMLHLKAVARGSRPVSIASSTVSAGTMSTQLVTSATSGHPNTVPPSPATEATYLELQESLKHFPTIKVLASNRKMAVTLIYGERTHRKTHKYLEKGKSNTINFPKEKREFLQIMGLPGKMITTSGLDFNMKPEIDSSGVRIHYSPQPSRSASEERSQSDNKENNGSVMETAIDSINKLSVCDEKSPTRTKRRLSAMNILKKPSVSPQPRDNSGSSKKSSKSSKKKNRSKRKDKRPVTAVEDVEKKSMLSCDSCSSSDGYESESDVNENDVAVPSNYAHVKNLQPEPIYALNLTYVSFELEKIGLQNTGNLVSPFLRMTVRGETETAEKNAF